MVTLFIRFSVAEFDKWREATDRFASTRRAFGAQRELIYRGVANPNDITMAIEFDRIESAQVFLISRELKAAMEEVTAGPPTIWFATKL